MQAFLVPLTGTASAGQQISDAVQSEVTAAALIASALIAGVALAAFGIKAGWVAWRAGSRAMGKVGT